MIKPAESLQEAARAGSYGQSRALATHGSDGRVTAHIHSSKHISSCTIWARSMRPALHDFLRRRIIERLFAKNMQKRSAPEVSASCLDTPYKPHSTLQASSLGLTQSSYRKQPLSKDASGSSPAYRHGKVSTASRSRVITIHSAGVRRHGLIVRSLEPLSNNAH